MIRKRILLLFIAIILSFSGMAAAKGVALPPDRGEIDVDSIRFFAQAARSLRDYDEENMTYISSITLTLDSDIMVVNGEEQNVLSPYMTEGKELLLPITDIAEALGAEVDIDDDIGEITIADDGGVTVLDAPPDIENYQLYDIQEVADVLTLDYFIEGDDIVLTRPFQSKTLLVWMRPGKKLSDTYGAANYLTDDNGHYVLKYNSVSGAKNAYDKIKDLPDCENAAPNLMFFVFSDPPAVESATSSIDPPNWGSARIHTNLMKNHLEFTGKTDTEIIVAVIDTGVESTHPFLAGRLLLGLNFTVEPRSDNTTDVVGHGTRVAGVVADCTPENVKILPAKVVYDTGFAERSDVADAILWAVDNCAKVINMSIGFTNLLDPPDWDILISGACNYAVSQGVAVVTAAGNATQGNPVPIDTRYVSPARLDSAITVTATDINDRRLAVANFGEAIDAAAPGVGISTSTRGGGYGIVDGTSFAAPHAAAAVAMLSLNDPSLGYEGLKAALISICVDLGEPGKDIYYGHGIIDFRVLFDHEHEWGTGVVTAPTCTSQGYTTYKCIHCELTDNRDFTPIDPDNHNYIAETPVAPTCTEQGYTTYTCAWCGDNYDEPVAIDPSNHIGGAYEAIITPATYETAGVMGIYCNSCDVLLGTRVIDMIDITDDFADPVFLAAVYNIIGKAAPERIYYADVMWITLLDIHDMGIQSLAGLEWFVNLERLYCQSNNLEVLDVLKNKELVRLYCYDNYLTELVVSADANPKLSRLYCYDNYLKDPDSFVGWRGLGLIINTPQSINSGTYRFYNQNNTSGVYVEGIIRSYNPNIPTVIRLMQGDIEMYKETIDGTAGYGQKDQSFTFKGVEPGIYTLVISKAIHTRFIVENIVVDSKNVDLTEDIRPEIRLMTLPYGDINGDGEINQADLNILWLPANYNKTVAGGANPLCDLNGDGEINQLDLNILWLLSNYNKGTVLIK